MFNLNYLKDNDFLIKLDNQKIKETFARVTLLTWEEAPIEFIEGKLTGGSISLDGNSAVQRTCTLSMISKDINFKNFLWGLNSKIKIEIGLLNDIEPKYPDIIWFPQGIFVLTSYNSSTSSNNHSISLQGKDKMCLLNGDVSGSLESSIDFGIEEFYDLEDESITYYHIPIKDIIKNAVNVYGKEPLHNIIIKDIDDYGYELLDYKGSSDTPMYLFRSVESGIFINATLNQNQQVYIEGEENSTSVSDKSRIKYEGLDVDGVTVVRLTKAGMQYTVRRVQENETVGYRLTDLTYAGDLICNAGESLTSILDKIKNMLGNFEYFYNIDGQFVFQEKQNNFYDNWNPLVSFQSETTGEEEIVVDASQGKVSYVFSNSELITSMNHNPNLQNLKNDFSIWGKRKSVTDEDLPIHLRYAIDWKPSQYTKISVSAEEAAQLNEEYGFETTKVQIETTYSTGLTYQYYNKATGQVEEKEADYQEVDWREIIYQMALDYYAYNKLDDFSYRLQEANMLTCAGGRTGYEQYYVDIQSFWRQLYNYDFELLDENSEPDQNLQYFIYEINEEAGKKDYIYQEFDTIVQIKSVDSNTTYYKDATGTEIWVDLSIFNEDETYYTKNEDGSYEKFNIYEFIIDKTILFSLKDYGYTYIMEGKNKYWNSNIIEAPETLNFWFDLLGEGTEMDKYSVPVLGARSKVINDDDISAIFFKETPEVLFIKKSDLEELNSSGFQTGYTYIQINESLMDYFNISSQGKSAKDVLRDTLNDYTYFVENVSINTIPIYYLQPNTRIKIYDLEKEINGDFYITKITVPLAYNGTMSISATQVPEINY